MEYEFYEDVVDAYEAGIGVEPGDSLTDYIRKNNIKIKEIEPFRTDAKEGGLMVAIQKFANGGGVGSMMQPKKKKFTMQGDKKPARNYLGEQKTVSNVPLKWQSGPDAPPTELAYITQKEKNLLLKKDLHGSLKNGPNTGPDGIMSLDSQGDYTRDRSSNNQANANSGSNREDRERAVRAEARMKDILTGQRNIGQTTKTGPKTRKYAVPEYVNVKQPDGTFKNKYVGSGYKSYGQPSFFGNLFSRGAPGYRGIKGMPAFFGKPGFEARQGLNGLGYYSDDENFGETRDAFPSFGLLGIAKNIINSFKKNPYEDMSEFNKLQNIDGQVIDPTGLELDKGMFGTSINNTIPDSIKNRSMVIDSPFDKKPPANITGDVDGITNYEFDQEDGITNYDFDPEMTMQEYLTDQASFQPAATGVMKPGGYPVNSGSIPFNPGMGSAPIGLQYPGGEPNVIQDYMEQDAGMYSGLPNQKAVNAAAMEVMSNAYKENYPYTQDNFIPGSPFDNPTSIYEAPYGLTNPNVNELTGENYFFNDGNNLASITNNELPANNQFAEVTQMDLDRKNQFEMLDYNTAKDIGMISPNLTQEEFEGIKSGAITAVG